MEQETNDLIKSEIENNDVCLFMKGTPDQPQCGLSLIHISEPTRP